MDMLFSVMAHLLALLLIALLARAYIADRRELAKLRAQCQRLSAVVEDLGQDLDGLCAAGVQLDRHSSQQEQRIRECLERLETLQAQENANSPYYGAIELIRRGATAQDVANELGISLSEADLLVRLHRSG